MKKEKEFTMGQFDKEKGVTMEYSLDVIFSKRFNELANWYSKNYEKEIGGFIIGEVKDGKAYLQDIVFPEQWVSGGEVEFKDGAIGKLRKEIGEEKTMKIIGEWHSHVKMGCFWSGTDLNDMIAQFMADFKLGIFVVSSDGKHLVRAETSQPWSTVLENLDYEIEDDEEENEANFSKEKKTLQEKILALRDELKSFRDKEEDEIKDKMMKVVEEKCETKKYKKPKNSYGKWQKYNNRMNKDWDDFTDEDWENYADSFNNQDNSQLNKDYQLYEMFSSNKKDFSIDLKNLQMEWADEIEQTFDCKVEKDPVDYTLSVSLKCNDKQHFRETKKEVKGLLKLLLEDAENENYYKGH